MKDFSQYKLDVKRSPKDDRDWKASKIYPKIELPTCTNNRELMFKVRDQDSQGACVAMAGSAMKEWQEVREWNLLNYLSPQFIYNNREDPSEEGMYMRDLMKILRQYGDCFEELCPYGTLSKPVDKAYVNASNYIIKNYAAVETIEELKTALYLNGPCVVAVPVYNFTERMWYQYPEDYFLGGHALEVADYDDVRDGFWIRNSWGTDWGQDGYCFMSYNDFSLAWEYWTTIDEKSIPEPPKPEKESWFKKYWWIIALSAVVAGAIIFLVLI